MEKEKVKYKGFIIDIEGESGGYDCMIYTDDSCPYVIKDGYYLNYITISGCIKHCKEYIREWCNHHYY